MKMKVLLLLIKGNLLFVLALVLIPLAFIAYFMDMVLVNSGDKTFLDRFYKFF
jgi:hypothetical protein